jgi:hypothetical protein
VSPPTIIIRRRHIDKKKSVNTDDVITTAAFTPTIIPDKSAIRAGLLRVPPKPLIICPILLRTVDKDYPITLFCNRTGIDYQISPQSLIDSAINMGAQTNEVRELIYTNYET